MSPAIINPFTVFADNTASATWVSLLTTEEEIASWNIRKTSGPFAVSDDFDNSNGADADNPGEYTAMAAAFGSTWSSSHWSGPSVFSAEGYVSASSSNDPSTTARAQAFDMLGASYKCLMDDRVSAGSGDSEATAIMNEIMTYATQSNLNYGNAALWPQLSSGYYEDLNPLFYHCLWVNRMVYAYSNCAALVGRNTTIEGWFSNLAYLAEHELHVSLSKPWPNRKSNDYETGRWATNGFNGDTTFDVWGDEADGTDVQAMTIQRWLSNRRVEQASLVLSVGVLLDDAVLIAEGERFLREWMGFGINVTTGSHPDYNRDDSVSLPTLGLDYQWKSWRMMMAAVDAAYRKGYTTAKTQTTSIGSTHATWGTQKTNKTLAECIGVLASWVDESIATQVYTPPNDGREGNATYRRTTVTPAGTGWYSDGWLVRAAALFGRSDWRDAARRVGTPEGFTASLQNDGGITGTRIGQWERFLDPWDDKDTIYNAGVNVPIVVEPSTSILGVGSASTSLADYPKIVNSTTGDWYVDASVESSGDGTSLATAFKTLPEGLAALSAGEKLVVKGGTYTLPSGGITRSTAWASQTIITGYGTERPVLDASSVGTNGSALTFNGSVNELWHRFHVKNVPVRVSGFNAQAIRFTNAAHDCIMSEIWLSHCGQDGFWGYTAYNIQFRDCAAWRLGDGVTTGTNAPDTFALTGIANVGLPGIRYVRCFSGHAGDDSFDFYRNAGGLAIDSVSYKAGYYWNGVRSGDGNGFKLGSNETNITNNGAIGCLAIGAAANGFDDNAMDDNVTMLRNTAVDCGSYGFQAGSGLAATINDNIANNNSINYREWAAIPDSYNTWNLGITNPNFADTANFDWSLDTGSSAIAAGISGGNLGASSIALEIAKEWLAKDLT